MPQTPPAPTSQQPSEDRRHLRYRVLGRHPVTLTINCNSRIVGELTDLSDVGASILIPADRATALEIGVEGLVSMAHAGIAVRITCYVLRREPVSPTKTRVGLWYHQASDESILIADILHQDSVAVPVDDNKESHGTSEVAGQ